MSYHLAAKDMLPRARVYLELNIIRVIGHESVEDDNRFVHVLVCAHEEPVPCRTIDAKHQVLVQLLGYWVRVIVFVVGRGEAE